MRHVCVAGAGPAGLAAAIFAARKDGVRVTLLEKMDSPGRKLLTTGGGHCNVTNLLPEEEWPARFGRQGRFITPALAFFPRRALEEWFAGLGQSLRSPDGFHLFPVSNSARAVRDALLAEAVRAGVRILSSTRLTGVAIEEGKVVAAECGSDAFPCDRVVMACGGKSYPATGSTWDGPLIAEGLGHRVVRPVPGLVGLRVANLDSGLAGLVLPRARVWYKRRGAAAVVGEGELLLTHGGVSGPAVLDLSATVLEGVEADGKATVRIAWDEEYGVTEWRERIDGLRKREGGAGAGVVMRGVLPQRLGRWLMGVAGMGGGEPLAQMGGQVLERLAGVLGEFKAEVTGGEGWERAMVTRGGVSVRDVVPDRLASRRVEGLYFAGEMLDVDGPCGGYNLHWAFASGALAGEHAATDPAE